MDLRMACVVSRAAKAHTGEVTHKERKMRRDETNQEQIERKRGSDSERPQQGERRGEESNRGEMREEIFK